MSREVSALYCTMHHSSLGFGDPDSESQGNCFEIFSIVITTDAREFTSLNRM